MKINYYSETDSLYIDLSSKESASSQEIAPGVVLDFDTSGHIVGIDIDNASKTLDLQELILSHLPIQIQKITA